MPFVELRRSHCLCCCFADNLAGSHLAGSHLAGSHLAGSHLAENFPDIPAGIRPADMVVAVAVDQITGHTIDFVHEVSSLLHLGQT